MTKTEVDKDFSHCNTIAAVVCNKIKNVESRTLHNSSVYSIPS